MEAATKQTVELQGATPVDTHYVTNKNSKQGKDHVTVVEASILQMTVDSRTSSAINAASEDT